MEHDSFNLLRVIIMMLVDIVIYCLLTWYIECVHPGRKCDYCEFDENNCMCIYIHPAIGASAVGCCMK